MSNLASVIMEGAGSGTSTGLYGKFDVSGQVVTESSYMSSACATLFSDIMEAEQAYMVSDVIGAATVIREQKMGNTVDIQAVTEGVIKDGIERIKAAFLRFIAKVKEFYKKVIAWFKAMFANAEDFSKQYGDGLRKKAAKVKNFHYTGFKYDISGGDSKANTDKDTIKGHIDTFVGKMDNVKTMDKTTFYASIKDDLGKVKPEDSRKSSSEVVDDFISDKLKASDVSEYRDELIEKYQGGTSKEDIKDFEGNSVDAMLKFLKESSKTISGFEKDLKKYEEIVNKIVQKLNSFTSKDSGTEGEAASTLVNNASYLSGVISAFLNLYKVPCDIQIGIYKRVSSEWLGVLKKFYSYRDNSVKEAAEFDYEGYGMLESSLVLESDKPEDAGDIPREPDGAGANGEDKTPTTESAVQSILEMAAKYV